VYCQIGENEEMEIEISNASEMEIQTTRTENTKNLEEQNDIIK